MFTIENIRIAHMIPPDHLKLNASPATKIQQTHHTLECFLGLIVVKSQKVLIQRQQKLADVLLNRAAGCFFCIEKRGKKSFPKDFL